jgi:hypothetical protein
MLAAARLAFRDENRAALATTFMLFLFFTYGHLFDHGWEKEWFKSSAELHRAVSLGYAVPLVLVLLFLRFTKFGMQGLAWLLGVFASVMLALSCVRVGVAIAQAGGVHLEPVTKAERPAPMITEEREDLPDIYFIVLDGYAREDVLKSIYHYDNAPFLDALAARGFFVAGQSRSNYMITHFSLAATLAMDYLPKFKGKSKRPYYRRVQDNPAARFLQGKGYRYVHFTTAWGGTEESPIADDVVRLVPALLQNEFMTVVLATTAARAIEPGVAALDLHMMEKVQEVPRVPGPTFAFLHLVLPHNPYVFNRDGTVRADIPMSFQLTEKTGAWAAKEQYIDQLVYLNSRVLEIIDTLVRDSPNPPVIILQSDHGSGVRYKRGTNWEKGFYDERTATLNAWYAPKAVVDRLSDDMHSVNTFRVLFATLFGEDLPDLPRRVYSTWFSKPYEAKEVTALIDEIDGRVPATGEIAEGSKQP